MGVCVLWVCWIASLSAGRISFSALVLLGERATSSPYVYLCNFLKFVTYNFFLNLANICGSGFPILQILSRSICDKPQPDNIILLS